MSLEDEIQQRSQEISTDAYAMSVGEVVSLYRDGELEIHPEFQRFFRWEPEQKSKFIESILLGIPIPSLFMSQTESGTWEVIDGLQRISTLLEVMGELKGPTGELKPQLRLLKTQYLPGLAGKVWKIENSDGDDELPSLAKLKIKRARLDLKIVLNTSDPKAKYELFQRLNTGGSFATDQEVRNCVLIMVNKPFFEWLANLGQDPNFRTCVPLTERALIEQYDLELVVRFLVFRTMAEKDLRKIEDLGTFLTERIIQLAEDKSYDRGMEERAFRQTFQWLADSLGDDSFKKFDPEKGKALGALLISVYEVMALGLGWVVGRPEFTVQPDKISRIHKRLWTMLDFKTSTGSGVKASTRIPVTVPLGRRLFTCENSES